jgi:hypothetical protein
VRRQAPSIAVLAVMLLAAPVLPSSRPSSRPASARAGSAGSALQFADGSYTGTLVYTGQLSYSVGTAVGSGNGPLTMIVNAGTVGVGSGFTFNGAATSAAPGASAVLNATITGIVDGPSEKPVLRGESGTFTGTAMAGGISVPISFSAGAAELMPASMNIDDASCTLVTGDFVQEYGAALSAQGISNSLYGRFSAVRTGDAPFPQQPEVIMAELLAQASELAQGVLTTGLDAPRLLMVVEQAEDFSTSLAKNTDCGFIEQADAFNVVITSVIRDLLELVTQDPEKFSVPELFELLTIGVRVGAIGEGALDQAKSDKILADFQDVVADRLTTAIAEKDSDEIHEIFVLATAMGWKQVASKAGAAL